MGKEMETVETIAAIEIMPTAGESEFALIQRKAGALANSELVPTAYQGNLPNCMIALELAERTKSSPFMVMQNVHIIKGRPSWSSSFIIAAINSSGRFSPLRYHLEGEGMERSCVAWAKDLEDGERLEGPPVTMEMAKAEGWLGKTGSKWKTMPELMLRYRAAAFFGRLYCPETLMGMHTQDELQDITGAVEPTSQAALASLRNVSPEPVALRPLEDVLATVGLEAPKSPAMLDEPPADLDTRFGLEFEDE